MHTVPVICRANAIPSSIRVDVGSLQVGQAIHVRALALDRSNHEAAASRKMTFEVEDSRGNKVFKKALEGWELAGVIRIQSGTPLFWSSLATVNQNSSGVVLHNITQKQLQSLPEQAAFGLLSLIHHSSFIVHHLPS